VGIHLTTGPLDISSWPGLLFAYTIALVPYAYIVVSPALRNMDTSLEEASRMSGAGPLRTALQVSLPAVGPALVSAALLIVIIAAALYSIPAIIGSSARIETLSVYIVYLTQSSSSGLNQSVAASMMLLVFLTGVWLLQRWITQRQRQVKISGKSASGTVVRLGKWRRPAQALIVAYLLSVSVLPFLALVVVALQPFWQANINPGAFTLKAFSTFISGPNKLGRDALMTSLELGAIGASIVMIVATIMVTYAHQVRGTIASFINGVTKIPAAISGLVIAVAILYTFAGSPFRLKGTPVILLLAYLVMFMPQASIAAETARGQVGDDLLESSAMSGASRFRTSWRVLWPLMRPGLAYGWAMIFVLVLGDLIAASILSGPGNMVVGSAIIEIYTGGIFSDLAVLGTVVCVTALVVVGLVVTVYGRRPGQRGVRIAEAPTAPTLTS
jgi:iron(III) transport system permease protein